MRTNDQDALDLAKDQKQKKFQAKKKNVLAVADFTMAFENKSLMSYIDKRTLNDWPKGHVGAIVDTLLKKYKPMDTMSKIEMKTKI